jgi:DNA-binding MarR family transcriptional regulator
VIKKLSEACVPKECKILTSSSGELMYSLHVLHGELEKKLETALAKKESLSLSQYLVLVGFASGDESLSQAKLAEKLRLTEATISRHIGILIERKLLIRKKEGSNRKAYALSLTELGVGVFQETEEKVFEEVEKYFSVLDNQEKIVANRIVRKVIKAITIKE